MEQDIKLRIILGVLRRNIAAILIATVAGGLLSFAYTKIILKPQYTASISLYVNNNEEGVTSTKQSYQDLTAASYLVETYKVVLSNQSILSKVSENLDGRFSAAEISKMLSMQQEGSTVILKISATGDSPEIAGMVCSALLEVARTEIPKTITGTSVEPVGEVIIPSAPSGPSTSKNTILGLLAGLVISVAVVLIIFFLDDTIGSDEEFTERIPGVPVLGEIPTIDTSKAKKHRRNTNHARV